MKALSLIGLSLLATTVALGNSAELKVLDRDQQFASRLQTLDLENGGYELKYKDTGTSIGLKLKKDGKKAGKWLPPNAAANTEAQVVAHKLAQFLHMSELVVPAGYHVARSRTLAAFEQMIENANERNKLRIENKAKLLQMLANNSSQMLGVYTPDLPVDSMEVLDSVSGNTLVSSHPLARFIQADDVMPSAQRTMSLKGVRPKTGPAPVATELELARQFSKLMVLDVLCGQWDRFSGGNLEATWTADTKRLYMFSRDNGGASMVGVKNVNKYLGLVSRFDRAQVQRLQRLLQILQGPGAGELVRTLQMKSDPKSLAARAQMVLSHVNASVANYGEDRAFFP